MRDLLKKLGFSEKEADVYLSAFKLGSGPISSLAKQSKIKRPTVYVILEKLNKMGLVTLEKKGAKQIFITQNPQKLLKLIEQKKKILEEKEIKLKKALPEFKKIIKKQTLAPTIRYYEGKEGTWNILDDLTESGAKCAWIIAPGKSYDMFGRERFIKNVILKRKQLGIKVHIIIDRHPDMLKLYNEWKKEKDIDFREYRVFTEDVKLDTLFYLYENKVSMVFLKEPPAGIIMENEKLFKVMKFMFDSLWKELEGKNISEIKI